MKRLTKVQRGVLDRLWAGETLCFNYRFGKCQFRNGSSIPNQTFRSLRHAGLIRPIGDIWVATKGDGDGGKV